MSADAGGDRDAGKGSLDSGSNRAPVAISLNAETNEDQPLTDQLVAQDADGDTLTYAIVTEPTHGTVTLDASTGAVTYTPNPNFFGEDTLTFSVYDGTASTTATVVIQVHAVNDAPSVSDSTHELVEDTASALTLSAADADGDDLTFTLVDLPDHGTLSGTPPDLTYTPAPDFTGADSFTFAADDGTASSTTATVQVTVAAANDAPVGSADSIATTEGASIQVLVGGEDSVLHNDTDIESETLTASVGETAGPEHGTLVLNPDGSFEYTHDGSETTSDEFTYQVCDDGDPVACSTAIVSITIAAVNDAPVATPDALEVEEGGTASALYGGATSVLDNDTDAEEGSLTVSVSSTPLFGTLRLNSDGTFSYTHDGSETAADGFSYTVCDDAVPQLCEQAGVTITVAAINDAPGATGDAITVSEGGVATALSDTSTSVLANDSDAEPGTLIAQLETGPVHGQLSLQANGTFSYTHDGSETTSDAFTYAACDDGTCSSAVMVTITIAPVNDTPLAINDAYALPEGATFLSGIASVRDNDTDAESGALTVTTTPQTAPTHGLLTLNADGTFSYTHDGGEATSDSFVYQICDPVSVCDLATVTLTIQPLNDDPVAQDDTIGLDEGTVATILAGGNTSVVDNDSDAEVGPLTAIVVQTVTHGSLTLNLDGTFEYTHDGSESTSDGFTYSVCDASSACDEGAVAIVINPVNETPLAADDAISLSEGGIATALVGGATSVLANDEDLDGDALSVRVEDEPSNGSLTLKADGTFVYTHDSSETTSDEFTYVVCDDDATISLCAIATVHVTVSGDNDAPVVLPDALTVAEGGTRAVLDAGATSVLANDSDAERATLTVSLVNDVLHGTLSLSSNGTFSYMHDGSENFADVFVYRACDGGSPEQCAEAAVTITITAVNDAPVANDDSLTVVEGATTNALTGAATSVLGNDSDAEGATLSASLAAGGDVAHGVLTLNPDGTFQYVHDGTETIADAFTYEACDGQAPPLCDTATVTIVISPSNDAPVAQPDALSVDEGGTATMLVGGATSVVGNDTDADLDSLTVSVSLAPLYGTLTLNPDGTFSYTHNGSETLADSFSYTLCDDGVPLLCAQTSVTIAVVAINDAPVAIGDAITVSEGGVVAVLSNASTSVLANDSDAELGTLSALLETGPVHGLLSLQTNGTFSYTHEGSETTSDTFTYVACDGARCSSAVTVTITIAPVNDTPSATDDAYALFEGATFLSGVASVRDNDTDAEPGALTVTTTPQTAPAHGVLTLNANGTFSYTHDGSETASDSFIYQICDLGSKCDLATVTLTIQPLNDPPVAQDDTIGLDEGTVATILVGGNTSVLGNDTDAEIGPLTAIVVQTVTHGNLTLNANGTFVYTHDGSESTSDGFTYSVCDASSACDQGAVAIVINPVNETPLAADDAISLSEGGMATVLVGGATSVLANDEDPDNDLLSARVEDAPSNGSLTLNADGTFIYTHNGSETTSDEFTYVVCDDDATMSLCAMATVHVTVSGANDAPAVQADALTVAEGGTRAVLDGGGATSVLANDRDAEGGNLTVSLATNGNVLYGTLSLNSDGTFSYTHNGSENLVDSFRYRACDNGSPVQCAEAAVTITITGVNDAPVANDDSLTLVEGATASALNGAATSVLGNDTDAEAGTLTVSLTAGGGVAHGALTLNPNGTFQYVHDGSETVADAFTYEACDGQTPSLCDTATVTITITPANDAPVANADAFTVAEGGVATSLAGAVTSVLFNDSDAESAALSATVVSGSAPLHGMLLLALDGTFSYTHDGGESTSDSFIYRVCEVAASASCAQATVSVTITAVNDPPDAAPDAFTLNEGGTTSALTGGQTSVLANDLDAELNPLTVTVATGGGPVNGSLTLNPNGAFSYTHNGSETTSDSFTYQVCDAVSCDTAIVSITVAAVNDAPLAVNDAITVAEGGTATVLASLATSLIANDVDPEGQTLAVTQLPIAAAAHGTLVLNTNGTFSYQHDGSEPTSDAFTYEVCDPASPVRCSNATALVTISSVNDAPIGVADNIALLEGATATALVGGATSVLQNDVDAELNALHANLLTGPVRAANFSLQAGGTFTYTHDDTENFTDSFTYEVCDDGAPAKCSAPVTVTIAIEAINESPVIGAETISVAEGGTTTVFVGGATSVLANDTGGPLTASLITGPTRASNFALAAGGTFTYTHNGSETASDSFTYQACTVATPVLCTSGSVSITITPVNDAPVAVADSLSLIEGGAVTALVGGATSVLANDADPESNPLQAMLVAGPSRASSFMLAVDGTFRYIHDGSETTSDTFTYRACDTGSPAACSNTVAVTIAISAVNDSPVAAADSILVNEGATATLLVGGDDSVLDNDVDPESNALTVTVIDPPDRASSFALSASGTFTYTHDGSETTSDAFTYQVCETAVMTNCATAVVSIAITPVNDAPVAGAYTYANVVGNTLYTVAASAPTDSATLLMQNDTDAENGTLSITAASTASAQSGVVSVNMSARTFTYLPRAGFTGADSFTYTVTDNGSPARSAVATVNLTVSGLVWYVNGAWGGIQSGRSSEPFTSVTQADAATPNVGSTIFVRSGAYPGVVSLTSTQQLVGEGVAFAPSATVSFTAGTRPTISNASHVVTLTAGNTVRGVNLTSTGQNAVNAVGPTGILAIGDATLTAGMGAGISIVNGGATLNLTNLGTITARTGLYLQSLGAVTIVSGGSGVSVAATSGPALDISGGTLSLAFNSLSSVNSTTFGVTVNAVTGTLTSGTTTISNPVTHGLVVQNVTAGTPTFNFGTCSVTAAGTAAGSTGDAYRFDNNPTANITVAISSDPLTANGRGVFASNSGTLRIAQVPAAITAAGGAALDLRNTTGSAVAANQWNFLALNSTNSTAEGVRLEGLNRTVQISGGTIVGSQSHGVYGANLAGLSLLDTTITNAGNATDENAVTLTQVSGSVTFERNLFTGMAYDGVSILNTSGSVNVTLTDVTIRQNDTGLYCAGTWCDGNGLRVRTGGAMTLVADNLGIDRITGEGVEIVATGPSSNIVATVMNGEFTNGLNGDSAIEFGGGGGSLALTIQNNLISNWGGHVVVASVDGNGADVSGTIEDNVITANNTFGTQGIRILGDADTVTDTYIGRFLVQNNTINDTSGAGIWVENRGSNLSGAALHVTIFNNTSNSADTDGFRIRSRSGTFICADVRTNSAFTSMTNGFNLLASDTSTLRLNRMGATPGSGAVAAQNYVTAAGNIGSVLVTPGVSAFLTVSNNMPCQLP